MSVPYEYAVIRVLPRVERGEQINAGVLLYCQSRDFLRARVELDEARLLTLDRHADVEAVRAALSAWEQTCLGEGPSARMSLGERFRWLTAPRSTVIQTSPAHTGLTDDPATELDRLLDLLVR